MRIDIQSEWDRYCKSTVVRRHGFPQLRELYCIGEGIGQPVKVGIAKDPESRCDMLSRATWRELRVYWSLPAMNFHERLMHKALSPRRLRWEWFADFDDLIKSAPICGGDTYETERLINWICQKMHSEVTQ